MMQTLEGRLRKPRRLTRGIVYLGIPYIKAKFIYKTGAQEKWVKSTCVFLRDMIELGTSFSYFK